MTITYSNGTVLQAVVLSHEQDELRAVAPGVDDVLTFTCIHGTWISEELEPVTITFAWERRVVTPAPTEDDCICPKDLAAHLIHTLLQGDEGNEDIANRVYAFGREGNQLSNQPTEL